MTLQGKVKLKLLQSGIPTLDNILGGGFPEYSFNLIAGDPGSGKTTRCHTANDRTVSRRRQRAE